MGLRDLIFLFVLTGCFLFSGLSTPSVDANELLLQHSSKPLQAESRVEALIPWETPIDGFFIRSHHPVPEIDPAQWRLTVDGLVDHEIQLSLELLKKMPQENLYAVLQCSGNRRGQQIPSVPGVQWQKGAVGNAEWEGVSLQSILKMAGVQAKGKFLRLEGADVPALPGVPKFIRSIPLEKLPNTPALIALKMNRVPIPRLHGGPARLVLPGWYGENWTKWIQKITVTEKEDPSFYMKKGYRVPKTSVTPLQPWDSSTGVAIEELQVQSLITSPQERDVLYPGKVRVSGKAFSGGASVQKVEISINDGQTWIPTVLTKPNPKGGWQEFSQEVQLSSAGRVTLLSRATDSRGNTQPLHSAWNPGGYIKNEVDHVSIEVSHQNKTSEYSLLKQRCQTCHALELVTSQRLSPSQWEATLKKMEGFGVKLIPTERETLLKTLYALSPNVPRNDPRPVHFNSYNETFTQVPGFGNPKKGQAHFQKHCQLCHGIQGEGLVGPRLKARWLSPAEFWSTVKWGRDLMPPFEAKLTDQEISDIRSYLNSP